MLWSSFATAKLKASIGFQQTAFDVMVITDRWRGVFVRRSYSTRERSEPVDASNDVSVWLNAIDVMESTFVGQARFCVGAELGLFRSYTAMPE